MAPTVSEEKIRQIVFAYHHDPFDILGAHAVESDGQTKIAIRAFLPHAREVWVVDVREPAENGDAGEEYPLTRVHEHGFFEAVFERKKVFKYRLKSKDIYGNETITFDPYAFLPVLPVCYCQNIIEAPQL